MIDLDAIESRAERRAQLRRYTIVSCRPGFAYEPGGDMVAVERDRTVTEYASETPPADADLALVIADARAHRTRADAAEAECARLRVEMEATERARHAAEDERDAALELVADDAVAVARQRTLRPPAMTPTLPIPPPDRVAAMRRLVGDALRGLTRARDLWAHMGQPERVEFLRTASNEASRLIRAL